MRMLITGVKDGKSCVLTEIEADANDNQLSVATLLDLPLRSLPPRAPGWAPFKESGLPADTLRWMRVRFLPNTSAAMHYTNSISCSTVMAGSTELILDDGPHKVTVGDSFVLEGLDHGWRTGQEGCTLSIVSLPLPPREQRP